MENKKLIVFVKTCTLIFLVTFFSIHVSAITEKNSNTFSFSFENCTVSEALKQVSEKSGINIISNSIFNKNILRKSYSNKSLDSIVANLLRGENCAVVWNYNEGNLHSIDIYSLDENDINGKADRSRLNRNTQIKNDRNTYPGNTRSNKIDEIKENILKSKAVGRNRSATPSDNSRKSSGNTPLKRTTFSSGTSGGSTNNRRTTDYSKNDESNNETEESEEKINSQSSSEPPEPEKGSGLERPPMPPGL